MKSDSARTFAVVMLILQAAATALLWILDVLSVETTAAFEVLLAADLIAFAVVLQIYRNPSSVESEEPAAQPAAAPPAAAGAPTAPASQIEAGQQASVVSALPRIIHVGLPIASFLVILVFAVVTFLPSEKSTLPPESTTLFIPIYLSIVVMLVFGSMYLFKRLLDTESSSTSGHN